jgi:hypothetical protein
MSTDLIKKTPGYASMSVMSDGHLKLVGPVKPGPILPVAEEQVKARNRRLIGVGSWAISHPSNCKLKDIKKRLKFHDEDIDPSESLQVKIAVSMPYVLYG